MSKRRKAAAWSPKSFTLPDNDLEKIAGCLLSEERLLMAKKFDAWSKLLRVSAFALDASGVTERLRELPEVVRTDWN